MDIHFSFYLKEKVLWDLAALFTLYLSLYVDPFFDFFLSLRVYPCSAFLLLWLPISLQRIVISLRETPFPFWPLLWNLCQPDLICFRKEHQMRSPSHLYIHRPASVWLFFFYTFLAFMVVILSSLWPLQFLILLWSLVYPFKSHSFLLWYSTFLSIVENSLMPLVSVTPAFSFILPQVIY